jgi:sulfatase modifying factor 1
MTDKNIEKLDEFTESEKSDFNQIIDNLEMVLIEGNSSISSFYIGKFLVTQKEYFAIMKINPSNFKGDVSTAVSTSNLPVETVSWFDAIRFCNALSKKHDLQPVYNESTGEFLNSVTNLKGYRLPSEAEWVFTAKGGNKSGGFKFSGSNKIDEVAWYSANSDSKTHPVGSLKPNELGIYDMSGNVWEWCHDWYILGFGRVIRGGSWHKGGDANYVSVSSRYGYDPDGRTSFIGFRVTRTS